jgi:hypothetical protein
MHNFALKTLSDQKLITVDAALLTDPAAAGMAATLIRNRIGAGGEPAHTYIHGRLFGRKGTVSSMTP